MYRGQTVRWIKMKLCVQVGLGPGHIVLDPVLLIIEIHENHEIHEIHMTKKRKPRNPAEEYEIH